MALVKMNYLSWALGMQTNITVVLPSFTFGDLFAGKDKPSYEQGMKYQVLWLLHGASGDDSDYLNFTNVLRYAEEHKLAVVMPPGFNSGYADLEVGAKYFQFVAEELPEICYAYFPLSDKPEDNFVGGLSMGGMGAMKTALTYPERFAAALIMSGSAITDPAAIGGVPPWANDTGLAMMELGSESPRLAELAKSNIEKSLRTPKFFITWGDMDFIGADCAYGAKFLTDAGYDVVTDIVPRYGHEWDFWDLSLRKAFAEWLPLKHKAFLPN